MHTWRCGQRKYLEEYDVSVALKATETVFLLTKNYNIKYIPVLNKREIEYNVTWPI